LVELLLHFTVPFASLTAMRLDWRKALFTSLIALLPDLDVLFHIHRSLSHSLVVLAIIILPILAIAHKNKTVTNLTLLAALGIITHIILDLFDAYTPLLYPISNQSFQILTSLDFHTGSQSYFTYNLRLLAKSYSPAAFQSFDGQVISTDGFAVSLVLLGPYLVTLIRNRAPILKRKWRLRSILA
jgi:membrane-bound metal-dependent hydrolase YbcI (DUF457 family)